MYGFTNWCGFSYFIPYICILIDLFHSILICDVTTITLNQSIKYIDTIKDYYTTQHLDEDEAMSGDRHVLQWRNQVEIYLNS